LVNITKSNFQDAAWQLEIIQETLWPYGLSHLTAQNIPYDLSFLKRIPLDYKDMSEEARRRLIFTLLIQQFYQLQTP
jgi:hypothetical protein